MSNWLILTVGAIYLAICVDLFRQGQQGMALTFFAYALGNLGMYLATRGI